MSVGDLVCDVSGVYWAWFVIAGISLLCMGSFVVLEWGVVSVLSVSVVRTSLCGTYGLAGGMRRGVWNVCCCFSCMLCCVLDVPVCFGSWGENVSDIVEGVWSDVER